MSHANLLAYAETRPGMIVSTRARRVGEMVEGLCISGFLDGAKPQHVVSRPNCTSYAQAIDEAAGIALVYWLGTARASGSPQWIAPTVLPHLDPVRADMVIFPVRTIAELVELK